MLSKLVQDELRGSLIERSPYDYSQHFNYLSNHMVKIFIFLNLTLLRTFSYRCEGRRRS